MVNRPLNILYLAHRIPYPPDKGEKIRSYHQIRRLALRHRVFLACLVDDPKDAKHIEALRKWCVRVETVTRGPVGAMWKVVGAWAAGRPLSTAPFHSQGLFRRVRRILADEAIDCVVVYSSAMAWYVRTVSDVPVIVDFVDVDAEKWRAYGDSRRPPLSWVYRREARCLAAHDREVSRRCRHAMVVSRTEADLFRRRIDERPVTVMTNGVDLEFFKPLLVKAAPSSPTLVFTGVMDYWPNVDAVTWFAQDVFPQIRAGCDDARFVIVGRQPAAAVSALARHPGVIVTGAVEDVRPYLASASAAVAPFRVARGVQNKVLEAMAMGLPVVGTPVAFQGLAAGRDDGIRVGDGARALAREALFLLRNDEHRAVVAKRARAFVERRHRWEDQLMILESLIRSAVGRPAPSRTPEQTPDAGYGPRVANEGPR